MTLTTSQEGKLKCPVNDTSVAAGLTGSKDSLSEEVNVHLQWLTEALLLKLKSQPETFFMTQEEEQVGNDWSSAAHTFTEYLTTVTHSPHLWIWLHWHVGMTAWSRNNISMRQKCGITLPYLDISSHFAPCQQTTCYQSTTRLPCLKSTKANSATEHEYYIQKSNSTRRINSSFRVIKWKKISWCPMIITP